MTEAQLERHLKRTIRLAQAAAKAEGAPPEAFAAIEKHLLREHEKMLQKIREAEAA